MRDKPRNRTIRLTGLASIKIKSVNKVQVDREHVHMGGTTVCRSFYIFYFLFFFLLFFLWNGNASLKHRTRKSGLAILNNSFSEFSKMEIFLVEK